MTAFADSDAWPAPAKLNLFLHVTGRRPDGYHELQTVFQFLDVGDLLWFDATPSHGIELQAGRLPGTRRKPGRAGRQAVA